MILLEGWISQVLESSLLLAIPVAVLAGVVSFASPCILPLLTGHLFWRPASAPLRSAQPQFRESG